MTKKEDKAQPAPAAAPAPQSQPLNDDALYALIKGVETFSSLNKMKIGLYGPNGVGKTTLISKFRRPNILLTEAQGIPSIKRENPDAGVFLMQTTSDIAKARRLVRVKRVQEEFDATVLDGLTDAQRMLKSYYTSQQKNGTDITHKDTWGVLIDATARLARELRDLPMHVIITMLDMEVFVDGVGVVHRPYLQGKTLPKDIGQYFNLLGFMRVRELDSGALRREVVFNAGERYSTKTMPELDDVEPPEPLVWEHKIFGTPLPDTRDRNGKTVRERWDEWLRMSPENEETSLPGDENKSTDVSEQAAPTPSHDPMA